MTDSSHGGDKSTSSNALHDDLNQQLSSAAEGSNAVLLGTLITRAVVADIPETNEALTKAMAKLKALKTPPSTERELTSSTSAGLCSHGQVPVVCFLCKKTLEGKGRPKKVSATDRTEEEEQDEQDTPQEEDGEEEWDEEHPEEEHGEEEWDEEQPEEEHGEEEWDEEHPYENHHEEEEWDEEHGEELHEEERPEEEEEPEEEQEQELAKESGQHKMKQRSQKEVESIDAEKKLEEVPKSQEEASNQTLVAETRVQHEATGAQIHDLPKLVRKEEPTVKKEETGVQPLVAGALSHDNTINQEVTVVTVEQALVQEPTVTKEETREEKQGNKPRREKVRGREITAEEANSSVPSAARPAARKSAANKSTNSTTTSMIPNTNPSSDTKSRAASSHGRRKSLSLHAATITSFAENPPQIDNSLSSQNNQALTLHRKKELALQKKRLQRLRFPHHFPFLVIANRDWKGTNRLHLSVRRGEQLWVLSSEHAGWFEARKTGHHTSAGFGGMAAQQSDHHHQNFGGVPMAFVDPYTAIPPAYTQTPSPYGGGRSHASNSVSTPRSLVTPTQAIDSFMPIASPSCMSIASPSVKTSTNREPSNSTSISFPPSSDYYDDQKSHSMSYSFQSTSKLQKAHNRIDSQRWLQKGEATALQLTDLPKEQRKAFNWALTGEVVKLNRYFHENPHSVAELLDVSIQLHALPALKHIYEAGGSYQKQYKGKTPLEMAFFEFGTSRSRTAFTLVEYCCLRSQDSRVLKIIKQQMQKVDITPSQLTDLCKWVVAGSEGPVLMSLDVSAFFKECAKKYVVVADKFQEGEKVFTQLALDLLGEIESDHIVSMLLETPDGSGTTCIDTALNGRNTEFLANARITKILNTLWNRPDFMRGHHFQSSALSLKQLSQMNPVDLSRSPRGKYYLYACSYFFFLLFFSILCLQRYKLVQLGTFSKAEIFLWLFAIGFVWDEVRELFSGGVVAYLSEGWNVVDLGIYFFLLSLMTIRVVGDPQDNNLENYSIFVSIVAVMMWLRLTILFVTLPSLGPLLQVVYRMGKDVADFTIFVLVFIIGFSLGFSFLLTSTGPLIYEEGYCWTYGADGTVELFPDQPCEVDGFGTVGDIFKSLWLALLGEFEFSQFDVIASAPIRIWSQLYFSAYLAFIFVLMFNLLIAMMATTYMQVKDRAADEYSFGVASLIWKYNASPSELPPPFNLITWSIFPLYVAWDHWCIKKPKNEGDEVTSLWTCKYCFTHNEPLPHEETFQMVQTYIEGLSKETTLDQDIGDLVYLDPDLQVCKFCFRNRAEIDKHQLMRENISLQMTKLVLSPLMHFIFFGAKLLSSGGRLLLSYLGNKEMTRNRLAQMDLQKKPGEELSSVGMAARSKWVTSLLQEPSVTLQDVRELLNNVNSRQKDIQKTLGSALRRNISPAHHQDASNFPNSLVDDSEEGEDRLETWDAVVNTVSSRLKMANRFGHRERLRRVYIQSPKRKKQGVGRQTVVGRRDSVELLYDTETEWSEMQRKSVQDAGQVQFPL